MDFRGQIIRPRRSDLQFRITRRSVNRCGRVLIGAEPLGFLPPVGQRFDFAIRAGKVRERGLVARPLTEIDFGLYASPTYLATRQGEDLTDDSFISVRPEEVSSARIQKVVGPTRTRVVVDDFAFARAVTQAGGGVALLPAFLVDEDVRAGTLRRVLMAVTEPGTP